MENERPLRSRVKRQRRNRARRIIMVLIILVLFMAVAAASFFLFSTLHSDRRQNVESGMMVSKDKVTVMIMGVDERGDDVGRSDTLMVATVDPEKNKAALLSVPRDTRVKIKGHGYDKINHAYAYGGHTLTQSSVENLLGVPMDHYVLVNIQAFKRIIDALGGIDIDVEKRMHYEDPYDDDGGLVINLYPGMQHMDGETAIQYVRYRDEEGDIGRISRQQKFMKAVLERISSPSIVIKLPGIVKEVSSAIKTDMSISKVLSLLATLKEAQANGLNTAMLPGKPAYINDISYWLPNVKELREMLANILDVRMDERIARSMESEAIEYERSIPKEMKVVDTPRDAKKITDKNKDKDKDKDKKTKTDASAERKRNTDGKDSSVAPPSEINVEVVNASGINGAGAEVKGILESRGFKVSGVSTLGTPYKHTTLITSAVNREAFEDLPFEITSQDGGGGGKAATIVIGRDYRP